MCIRDRWEASDSQKDGEGNTPLHIACLSGQGELVRTLIQKHPQWLNEVNDRHETPLLLAAGTNNLMIAQLLIQAQADVNLRSCLLYTYGKDSGDRRD